MSEAANQKDMTGRQREFIASQNLCPLCEEQLEIHVESYLEDFMLREEAHCPNCEVLARIKDHKMQ